MKFGILHWTPYTADYPADKQFAEIMELARGVRDAGYDLFAANHSYLSSPLRVFQPIPLLSALASETGNMDLLTGIFLLALHNPVEIAEQVATLDVISGGRFIFRRGRRYSRHPVPVLRHRPRPPRRPDRGSVADYQEAVDRGRGDLRGSAFFSERREVGHEAPSPSPILLYGSAPGPAGPFGAQPVSPTLGTPARRPPWANWSRGLEYYKQRLEGYGKEAPAQFPSTTGPVHRGRPGNRPYGRVPST